MEDKDEYVYRSPKRSRRNGIWSDGNKSNASRDLLVEASRAISAEQPAEQYRMRIRDLEKQLRGRGHEVTPYHGGMEGDGQDNAREGWNGFAQLHDRRYYNQDEYGYGDIRDWSGEWTRWNQSRGGRRRGRGNRGRAGLRGGVRFSDNAEMYGGAGGYRGGGT